MQAGQVSALEDLLLLDPGARNVRAFSLAGQLESAARSLHGAERVVLTSGFPVRTERGDLAPETDGPDVSFALGEALRELGGDVRYVCGPFTAPLFEALGAVPLDVLNLREPVLGAAADYLSRSSPTHLVAVERPGRARDGSYYSMKGERIGDAASAIDALFLAAADVPDLTTIGVGDGGNEVGMGALLQSVTRAVPHGERIASVVPTDFCIVAGVSTWGGYALLAALSLLAGRDLLPTSGQVQRRLGAIVAAGAVDGVSGRAELTIDGQPLPVCLEVLERARAALG